MTARGINDGTVPAMQESLSVRATGPAAVVFDLDDTLIDHERWSLDRFRDVAIDLGLNSVEGDAFLQACRERLKQHEWTGLVEDIASATCVPFGVLQESYSRQVGRDAVCPGDGALRRISLGCGITQHVHVRGIQYRVWVYTVCYGDAERCCLGVCCRDVKWHKRRDKTAGRTAERLSRSSKLRYS